MSFQEIAVERLMASPLNPRKHFDEAKLQELAQSIAGVGIIEPLVVRSRPELDDYVVPAGMFEVIAGARRLRAAQLAGLETVPAIVKNLTDAQVLEIMVIENNQREDVNPLEEGDGFARLQAMGYDLDRLAEKIGRSKKFIYDRIKLLDLVPEAKQLLLDGKITAGHGILLARLKEADQERAINPNARALFEHEGVVVEDDPPSGKLADIFDDEEGASEYENVKPRSVRELKGWISRHVRFDVRHAAQAAPLDFGEVAEQVDAALAKPGRGKKVIAITFDHVAPEGARSDEERTYGSSAFKMADGVDGKECEYSVLGVVAAGTRYYGRAFHVCIARDKCQVHWKAEILAKKKTEQARESVAEGRAAAKDEAPAEPEWKRQERLREEAHAKWQEERARLLPAFVNHVKGLKVDAGLIRLAVDRWPLQEAEKLAGKLTNANMGQLLALVAIDTYSRESFARTTKPFGFKFGALVEGKKKPAAAAPSKKAPAKKVQTSAKTKKAKKR